MHGLSVSVWHAARDGDHGSLSRAAVGSMVDQRLSRRRLERQKQRCVGEVGRDVVERESGRERERVGEREREREREREGGGGGKSLKMGKMIK